MVLGKVLKASTSTFQMYLSTSTSTCGGRNPFTLGSRGWVVKLRVGIVYEGSTLSIVIGKFKMNKLSTTQTYLKKRNNISLIMLHIYFIAYIQTLTTDKTKDCTCHSNTHTI